MSTAYCTAPKGPKKMNYCRFNMQINKRLCFAYKKQIWFLSNRASSRNVEANQIYLMWSGTALESLYLFISLDTVKWFHFLIGSESSPDSQELQCRSRALHISLSRQWPLKRASQWPELLPVSEANTSTSSQRGQARFSAPLCPCWLSFERLFLTPGFSLQSQIWMLLRAALLE